MLLTKGGVYFETPSPLQVSATPPHPYPLFVYVRCLCAVGDDPITECTERWSVCALLAHPMSSVCRPTKGVYLIQLGH